MEMRLTLKKRPLFRLLVRWNSIGQKMFLSSYFHRLFMFVFHRNELGVKRLLEASIPLRTKLPLHKRDLDEGNSKPEVLSCGRTELPKSAPKSGRQAQILFARPHNNRHATDHHDRFLDRTCISHVRVLHLERFECWPRAFSNFIRRCATEWEGRVDF